MTEENKPYQLTCLFSPWLDPKKIEEISQKIKKWILEKGGSLSEKTKSSIVLKKRLAYPLKKYQEAFYFNLDFLLASQLINQLSQQLNLEKDILRHFVIAKQKLKTKPIKETLDYKIVDRIKPLVAKEVPLSEKSAQEKTLPDKKEKVKLEELDKKIEEILNQ